jgi:tetratricopeptide (TPR) repeat protein
LAYAHFFAGRFDEAGNAASMAVRANPRFSIPWLLRAAVLAKTGRIDEAKASAQRVVDLEPDFSIRRFTGDQVHESGAGCHARRRAAPSGIA